MIRSIVNLYCEIKIVSNNVYIRSKNFYNDNIAQFFETEPTPHNGDDMDEGFVVLHDPFRKSHLEINIPIGEVSTNNIDNESE